MKTLVVGSSEYITSKKDDVDGVILDARNALDDEAVFSSDQIKALHAMLISISDAIHKVF